MNQRLFSPPERTPFADTANRKHDQRQQPPQSPFPELPPKCSVPGIRISVNVGFDNALRAEEQADRHPEQHKIRSAPPLAFLEHTRSIGRFLPEGNLDLFTNEAKNPCRLPGWGVITFWDLLWGLKMTETSSTPGPGVPAQRRQ